MPSQDGHGHGCLARRLVRTHLEEIDTTLAALFFGTLCSLDAFSDGIFNVCTCELSWWWWAEDTPLCGAEDLLSDVGGKR